jgi:hypothetical protein
MSRGFTPAGTRRPQPGTARPVAGPDPLSGVVRVEPSQPGNPLLSAPNCLITPHVAWASLEARTRLMHVVAANLAAFLAGQPQNVVNAAP